MFNDDDEDDEDDDDDDNENGVTLTIGDRLFNSDIGGDINIDDDDDEEEEEELELEIETDVFTFTKSKVVTLSIPIVANELLLMFAFFFCRYNAASRRRFFLSDSLFIRFF